ncbi:MAG TPA: SGNH/GDSL hydrolase family protein, partial [Pseudolysinimonas sp.]
MIRRPDLFIMNRLLKSMVSSSLHRGGQLPIPSDTPVVYAAGSDPDRLLLIGSGPVAGIGVTSHQLGIGGQLARRISTLTGRGVDLELMGSDDLVIEQAQELLDATDLTRFDAIVLMVGIGETIGLDDIRRWRTHIRRLLETASAAPQVFVVGITDFSPYIEVPRLFARAMRRHGIRLNEVTESVAATIPGTQFVPFAPERPDHFTPFGSVKVYERWANAMAPAIASGLDPA